MLLKTEKRQRHCPLLVVIRQGRLRDRGRLSLNSRGLATAFGIALLALAGTLLATAGAGYRIRNRNH
jgi:hypothetical protein